MGSSTQNVAVDKKTDSRAFLVSEFLYGNKKSFKRVKMTLKSLKKRKKNEREDKQEQQLDLFCWLYCELAWKTNAQYGEHEVMSGSFVV